MKLASFFLLVVLSASVAAEAPEYKPETGTVHPENGMWVSPSEGQAFLTAVYRATEEEPVGLGLGQYPKIFNVYKSAEVLDLYYKTYPDVMKGATTPRGEEWVVCEKKIKDTDGRSIFSKKFCYHPYATVALYKMIGIAEKAQIKANADADAKRKTEEKAAKKLKVALKTNKAAWASIVDKARSRYNKPIRANFDCKTVFSDDAKAKLACDEGRKNLVARVQLTAEVLKHGTGSLGSTCVPDRLFESPGIANRKLAEHFAEAVFSATAKYPDNSELNWANGLPASKDSVDKAVKRLAKTKLSLDGASPTNSASYKKAILKRAIAVLTAQGFLFLLWV